MIASSAWAALPPWDSLRRESRSRVHRSVSSTFSGFAALVATSLVGYNLVTPPRFTTLGGIGDAIADDNQMRLQWHRPLSIDCSTIEKARSICADEPGSWRLPKEREAHALANEFNTFGHEAPDTFLQLGSGFHWTEEGQRCFAFSPKHRWIKEDACSHPWGYGGRGVLCVRDFSERFRAEHQ
jgi:hypothetical protein